MLFFFFSFSVNKIDSSCFVLVGYAIVKLRDDVVAWKSAAEKQLYGYLPLPQNI